MKTSEINSSDPEKGGRVPQIRRQQQLDRQRSINTAKNTLGLFLGWIAQAELQINENTGEKLIHYNYICLPCLLFENRTENDDDLQQRDAFITYGWEFFTGFFHSVALADWLRPTSGLQHRFL